MRIPRVAPSRAPLPHVTRYALGKRAACQRRAFVFRDGTWFERHVGRAGEAVILEHLRDLDNREDWWVVAYFACHLSPEEVDGMSAEALAALLWNFAAVRRRLRSRNG